MINERDDAKDVGGQALLSVSEGFKRQIVLVDVRLLRLDLRRARPRVSWTLFRRIVSGLLCFHIVIVDRLFNRLFVHCPAPLWAALRTEVDALGPVRVLVASSSSR